MRAFRVQDEAILLRFADGAIYRYDTSMPGAEPVAAMKRLAAGGSGLTTYVNRHVRTRYASRIAPPSVQEG